MRSSDAPTKSAIKTGVGLAAAQAILAAGENPAALTFTGLAQGVKLHMHAYQTDYASPVKNESEIVTSPAFISAGEPDSVAPILTLPTIEPGELGKATGGITTTEGGMAWSVLTGSDTKPLVDDVIAGVGVASAHALLLPGKNDEVFNYTGLPEAVQLYQHTAQRDNADISNTSLVVTSAVITTSKTMVLPPVNQTPIVNPISSGRIIRCGPTRGYKLPSVAIASSQEGDTILIDAGEYPGDCVAWYHAGLHIKGVGGIASAQAMLTKGSNYGRFVYPDSFGEGVQLWQHVVQQDSAVPPNTSEVTTSVRFTTTKTAGTTDPVIPPVTPPSGQATDLNAALRGIVDSVMTAGQSRSACQGCQPDERQQRPRP